MSREEGEPFSTSNPQGQSAPLFSKKRRIRGGYRAHTKKIFSECRSIFGEEHPSKSDIERLCVILKEKLKILRNIDEEIFSTIPDEDIEKEVMEAEDWQCEIQKYLFDLESKLREVGGISSPSSDGGQSIASQPAYVASSSSSHLLGQENLEHIANQPSFNYQNFRVNPKQCQEFLDAFGIIHGSSTLPSVNKLRHLKALLEGQAAAAISGLQTTNANYEIAVDILKNRFAQKQIIVNSYIESLTSLPDVTSDKDIKGLRKLVDGIDTNIRNLKSLGYDLNQYGPLLNPMIVGKLPDEIRLSVTKQMRNKDWELAKLLELIKGELEPREQCAHLTRRGQMTNSAIKPNQRTYPTTSALVNNTGKVTCSFCRNPHPSARCNVVTNPGQRKNILISQGRCFLRLKKGHLSRNCSSNNKCFRCKMRHHVSICDRPEISTGEPAATMSTPSQNTSTTQPRQTAPIPTAPSLNQPRAPTSTVSMHVNAPTSTLSMRVSSKSSILLQTAKGYISPATNPGTSAVAQLIFDSGIKHSYISE